MVEVECEPHAVCAAPPGQHRIGSSASEAFFETGREASCNACAASQTLPCAMLLEMLKWALDEMWRMHGRGDGRPPSTCPLAGVGG